MILDGTSYHKYGELRDFLCSVNRDKEPSEWLITCILFAPNSPQQNPVEDIWLQAQNFLRKYWYLCRYFKIIKLLFDFLTKEHKFDFPKLIRTLIHRKSLRIAIAGKYVGKGYGIYTDKTEKYQEIGQTLATL